ncbi:MAG: ferric reductase-like transmembrane domain-containing protein [Actinomycetota bacterium]
MIVSTVWWYLSRSTGLVAAVLIIAAFIWGVLLSTQLVKPVKKPAWLLDLHRWLGTLAVVFVVLHLVALLADSYVEFDITDILVPFASEWKPAAVAWGVVGLYLLVIIQLSSWQPIRSRISRRVWHAVHLISFPLVWVVIMHSGAAGTDVTSRYYTLGVLALVTISVFVVLYRILAGTGRKSRGDRRRERVSVASGDESSKSRDPV